MDSKVQMFAAAARDYCAWVEGEPGEPRAEAQLALTHLARLYHLALTLRKVEPELEEYVGADLFEKRNRIYKERFVSFPIQYFGVVYDPLELPPQERIEASAPDGLADIWQDLMDGLEQWDAGHHQEAEWRWENMLYHWGHHAVELTFALHVYLTMY